MIDLDALERAIVGERTYPYDPLWLREYVPSLIAELRAARKVVEAARAVQDDAWNDEEGYISPDHWNALSAALAELEALK